LHTLNHKGKYFSVKGPLNVARPPQGYPVIVQAGASEPGRELAARTAEVIFTANQTLADAQEFYSDVKGRLAKYRRSPHDLKIMPGAFPVIGRTEEEAQEKYEFLQSLIHPDVAWGILKLCVSYIVLSPQHADIAQLLVLPKVLLINCKSGLTMVLPMDLTLCLPFCPQV
jgi:alkanesulfonate monooxygenase SsuD/methylene tetrahydromethanopterin reductase-like flavin-dependent oxidoreductase (luciferase family)